MTRQAIRASDLKTRAPIGGRYLVGDELGRGGAAVVYRVRDSSSQRELALKQLWIDKKSAHYEDQILLFEREFQTLTQLSHPRIIEVYDFGHDPDGPYYTMELLDGGDLKERSPLPWREACRLIFDVCSSLALLHSRGLLHRDISPRNVRCSRDGTAKLIDFGAMVAIGPCHTIVGTPPFVAPEALLRSVLDARADLFSLGATLYSALTGRLAYPARKFDQLVECWKSPPAPPSSVVPEIPAALDALVMSLISVDLGARPHSAADVMPRLAAIAGIEHVESLDVSQAYLQAPVLVGRRNALARFKKRLARTKRGHGGSVLVSGAVGSGRSRMLDACVLEAQIMGATVLRAGAHTGKDRPLALIETLLEQLEEAQPELVHSLASSLDYAGSLFELVPEAGAALESFTRSTARLKDISKLAAERSLQDALHTFLLDVSEWLPLVIVVDDFDRVEPASAGLLAGLVQALARKKLLVVAAVASDASPSAPLALQLLEKASTRIELAPLGAEETEALVRSVFGDVPHIASTAQAIFELSRGNPRECMALAQHLVDHGSVRYEGGSWTLPGPIDRDALPARVEDAFLRRAAGLCELARYLAECQALAYATKFERADYLALVDEAQRTEVEAAIDELVAQQVVVSDGIVYTLAHKTWALALRGELDAGQTALRHRALASACERRARHPLLAIHHLLAARDDDAALDRLAALFREVDSIDALHEGSQIDPSDLSVLFETAHAAAERAGRKPRELYTLKHWLLMFTLQHDDSGYWKCAPDWLARLKRDSGLDVYESLDPALPAQERLARALQAAVAQYEQTPEAERVYKVDEAIRLLVYYVGVSIAFGARVLDEALLASLPPLLEPFVGFSPIVQALWQNAIATAEMTCMCHSEDARARWLNAITQIEAASDMDARYLQIVRHAMLYGVALLESSMGFPAAWDRIDELAKDPLQAVSALGIRKIIRLHQGDWQGAERYRREAELLSAHGNMKSLFNQLVHLELYVYAVAGDLTGVKRARDMIAPLAARHRGWAPFLHLANGHLNRLRGDLPAARAEFERGLSLCEPNGPLGKRNVLAWIRSASAYLTTLIELGCNEEAFAYAESARSTCERLGVRYTARDLMRAIALAEGRHGDFATARRRLDALIEVAKTEAVTGLELGAAYEAHARLSIWSGDEAAFDEHATLTGQQFRRGDDSSLSARYERLLSEAQRSGLFAPAKLSEFASTMRHTSSTGYSTNRARLESLMLRSGSERERAERMLELLCEAKGALVGHLYLCNSGGLRLAASTEASPPDELTRAVEDYFATETANDDIATMTLTRVAKRRDASKLIAGCFVDEEGHTYQSFLLSALIEGVRTYAGVATLHLDGEARERSSFAELSAMVARCLIDNGDVSETRS